MCSQAEFARDPVKIVTQIIRKDRQSRISDFCTANIDEKGAYRLSIYSFEQRVRLSISTVELLLIAQ